METHNDRFSIAVDDALLKLSKDFGIALPKDDYILIQLFLNKEIIKLMMEEDIKKLNSENEKAKLYFRKALVQIAKENNKVFKKYNQKIKILLIISTLTTTSTIATLYFLIAGV